MIGTGCRNTNKILQRSSMLEDSVDKIDARTRSRNMARIRGRNTKPEKTVRSLLYGEGFRFRLHDTKLPGTPDIVMRGRGIVIFVHGCYWHRHAKCANATIPNTNRAFWVQKLQANVRRDRRNIRNLVNDGWRVLVIWECAVRNARYNLSGLARDVCKWIGSRAALGEIRG